jgi:hypothetical protein
MTVLTIAPPDPVFGGIFFSTTGNVALPGLAGTPDNSDIYTFNGSVFDRAIDAAGPNSLGLPAGANVDGFASIDQTHFYLSFSNKRVIVPGIGKVQDEDVVYYNAGSWSLFFDGTSRGLTKRGHDIDAIDVRDGILYFSTLLNARVGGLGGTPDNADVYSFSGSTFARVVDASAAGGLHLSSWANVDGLEYIDAQHILLSFSKATTAVPTLGPVQDEDVVAFTSGAWSLYFDGTAYGLTVPGLDVDDFDLSL